MNPLQQQAQRAASTLQQNKQQQSRQAEKTQERQSTPPPRDTAAQRRPQTPPLTKQPEAQPHDKPRRAATRERASSSADTPQLKRKAASEPAYQEASLFSQLLDGDSKPLPLMGGSAFSGFAGLPASVEKTPSGGASPMAIWHQLEPTLTGAVEKQPSGPLSLTLLLPKLGEVDARIAGSAAGSGWDISLRFAPQALAMLAPHHERCRESLRRRMACQVRLRFEQRGGMA
ncbi:type III secretion system HrpP C-terminal domain-containing protein [Erwinia sp. V71]|uniref:type III secretion system HrpP C-terminal domain-containing protein n=1 Tax=Erwinia sp. V71 TaxID=3369424 RepID=UPI003F5D64BF